MATVFSEDTWQFQSVFFVFVFFYLNIFHISTWYRHNLCKHTVPIGSTITKAQYAFVPLLSRPLASLWQLNMAQFTLYSFPIYLWRWFIFFLFISSQKNKKKIHNTERVYNSYIHKIVKVTHQQIFLHPNPYSIFLQTGLVQ